MILCFIPPETDGCTRKGGWVTLTSSGSSFLRRTRRPTPGVPTGCILCFCAFPSVQPRSLTPPAHSVSSIEYWFRCMDLDGDGVLSMYELEYFYEEQCQKLETMAIEPLPFEDCLCQMLDLVKPEVKGQTCTFRHTHLDGFHLFNP